MQITHAHEGKVAILEVTGRIDAATADELERACIELSATAAARLLLDLGGVLYVSSAGLRVFLVVAKRLDRAGGSFGLCALPPVVQEVIAISGFDRILKIGTDRAAGINLLS